MRHKFLHLGGEVEAGDGATDGENGQLGRVELAVSSLCHG